MSGNQTNILVMRPYLSKSRFQSGRQCHKRLWLDSQDPLGRLRQEIRAAGCAAIRDTNLPGISAVAAPIYDYTGHVVAVLCALGASGGFDPDPQGVIAQTLREEANRVSSSLGYRA